MKQPSRLLLSIDDLSQARGQPEMMCLCVCVCVCVCVFMLAVLYAVIHSTADLAGPFSPCKQSSRNPDLNAKASLCMLYVDKDSHMHGMEHVFAHPNMQTRERALPRRHYI